MSNKLEDFFVPENEQSDKITKHSSPSGKYELTVTPYGTGPNTWAVTLGEVREVATNKLIAAVQRNYSSFPFLFIEDHVDGHDYLICGYHYQKQTFIQLDTGEVKQTGANDDTFCWASYKLINSTTLMVSGCYWADPYMIRLYDVSDPMKGWPSIQCLDSDGDIGDFMVDSFPGTELKELEPSIFEWTESRRINTDGNVVGYDEDEVSDSLKTRLDHRIRYRREGNILSVVEEWKSPELLAQEERYRLAEERRIAKVKELTALDPISAYVDLIPNITSKYIQYPSYNEKKTGEPNTFFRGCALGPKREDWTHSASIEWGIQQGPIVLKLWVYGSGTKSSEFPRTPEGVDSALDVGKAHILAGKSRGGDGE